MIFRRWLINLRRFWLLAIVAIFAVFAIVRAMGGSLLEFTAPACDQPPTYHAGVPEALRQELQMLFENELLYCETPRDAFEGLDGPVYWGSEGTTSLLFFQAADLSGVGVSTYGFGEPGNLFDVTSIGGAPPATYGELRAGSPTRSNQATVEDPTYFVLRAGPPLTRDVVVQADIRGPRPADENRLGGRDALRDVEALWDRVTGSTGGGGGGRIRSSVSFAIDAMRWEDRTLAEEIVEELRPEEKVSRMAALREANEEGRVDSPMPYRVLRGPLASSVWVAGVMTDTRPVLELAPDDGPTLSPTERALFTSRAAGIPLAMFTFGPLEAGRRMEARFWTTADQHDAGEPPTLRWPVVIP